MGNQSEVVEDGEYAVEVRNFDFEYDNMYGKPIPALKGVDFKLPHGSRCLLLGSNGAGKSSLLRILAGKHLHKEDQVLVLGKPAFYQTLGLSGISYLGGSWTRTVAFAGNNVPYQADIKVKDMCRELQDSHPERREELYEILEIDPEWRMHQVSDGQRRRVQIMLELLRPFKLLLLDEMTVDLDVLARQDFLSFLKQECDTRRATIIYATHIFDGMGDWPTDVLMLDSGETVRCCPWKQITEEPGFKGLYHFVESFLRDMQKKRKAEKKLQLEQEKDKPKEERKPVEPFADRVNSGFTSGRMMAYFASN